MGYNTLGGVVKKLCRDAGIEGNFTNHSLRTTMAARGMAAYAGHGVMVTMEWQLMLVMVTKNRSWRRKVVTAVSET